MPSVATEKFVPYGYGFLCSSQTKAKKKVSSVGSTHDREHLSPGSVLEASFSNDSCVSSSIDDSSGKELNL